jgi:hypothetical protein
MNIRTLNQKSIGPMCTKKEEKTNFFGFVFAKSDEGKLVLIGEGLFKVAIDISPLTLQTLLFRFDFLS